MLSAPGGMWLGYPGGCGCCSPEWGMNLVEMCGLAACWVEWVPTRDLSGTRIVVVGLIGESERRNHNIKTLIDNTWLDKAV